MTAFREYASLRAPIMDEIISGVLPNIDSQLRTFLVGEYHIQMVSALVMQLLQVIYFAMPI